MEVPRTMEAEEPMLRKVDIELDDSNARRRKGTMYQIAICMLACSSIIGPAMTLGYSAVTLGPLSSPKNDIRVSPAQASWIASIAAIAIPIGCISTSVTMKLGRRFTLTLISVVSVTGWLVIYYSRSVEVILVGRAITGISMGLASTPPTVYGAEVASPKLRGIVGTWNGVSTTIGILTVYILGYVCGDNWRLLALLCCTIPGLSGIAVFVKLPESPVWLRQKGRGLAAEKTLRKIHGIRIQEAIPDYLLRNFETTREPQRLKSWKELFYKSSLKPLFILIGYFFFQQLAGLFVVIYYAVDFTREAGVQIDGNLAAIFIGISRLIASLSSGWLSRKYGRRKPSIASGAGMSIFMGILAAHTYFESRGYELPDRGIIPIVALLGFIFVSTVGFGTIPFAMIGELFPAKVKDIYSAVTSCLAYVCSFAILKVYPDMKAFGGKDGVFAFYAIVSVLGAIFVAVFLPETKGKTLDEIEESFKSKKENQEKIESVTVERF